MGEIFRASAHQRAIFDFMLSGQGNAVVRATAGSGKTTTLVEVAKRLPEDLKVCFLAFGRDAANELEERLPKHMKAQTVHAAGRKALSNYLRKRGMSVKVEQYKYHERIKERMDVFKLEFAVSNETLQKTERYLQDLLNFARLNLTNTKDPLELRDLAVRYNLEPPTHVELEDAAHEVLPQILRVGADLALKQGICDFGDMIYLPYHYRLYRPDMQPKCYDIVCVDEAQDYSPLALEFTMLMVKPGGRMLFVGDPRQAIFGFAGADPDALDRIIEKTRATVLPLSVTYRCPKLHVDLAQNIAPEIEVSPVAPEGRVYWIHDSALEKWTHSGTLVLCRLNAPLIQSCLRLVQTNKKAYVQGANLKEDLERIASNLFRRSNFLNYLGVLESFKMSETVRLIDRFGNNDHTQQRIAKLVDQGQCLVYLIEALTERGAPSLERLKKLIKVTFAEEEDAVIFSTVHRAKGQEAERVVILYPELMPASYAHTKEAILGEECIMFVALTRAKRDLVFVKQPPKDSVMDTVECMIELGIR